MRGTSPGFAAQAVHAGTPTRSCTAFAARCTEPRDEGGNGAGPRLVAVRRNRGLADRSPLEGVVGRFCLALPAARPGEAGFEPAIGWEITKIAEKASSRRPPLPVRLIASGRFQATVPTRTRPKSPCFSQPPFCSV
ncbi:MAG: hypothetical protein DWQ01_02555 [Planctomycetota bacterium]|nr:MAG: hypothetical protein DWQ01_02555 [Planctomycetota bacterium]